MTVSDIQSCDRMPLTLVCQLHRLANGLAVREAGKLRLHIPLNGSEVSIPGVNNLLHRWRWGGETCFPTVFMEGGVAFGKQRILNHYKCGE